MIPWLLEIKKRVEAQKTLWGPDVGPFQFHINETQAKQIDADFAHLLSEVDRLTSERAQLFEAIRVKDEALKFISQEIYPPGQAARQNAIEAIAFDPRSGPSGSIAEKDSGK